MGFQVSTVKNKKKLPPIYFPVALFKSLVVLYSIHTNTLCAAHTYNVVFRRYPLSDPLEGVEKLDRNINSHTKKKKKKVVYLFFDTPLYNRLFSLRK
jgi:hypothetical protein